jgi:hypothetical protein
MKKALALTAALLVGSVQAAPGDVWVLLAEDNHPAVFALAPSGATKVLTLEGVVKFGDSKQAIGFLTYDTNYKRYVFRVLDKATRTVRSTWPLPGTAPQVLSGADRAVVMNDQFAYFVMMRQNTDESPTLDELTGQKDACGFALYRLSLADGAVKPFALPKNCLNPRMNDFGGVPVVTVGGGIAAYALDVQRGVTTDVISTDVKQDIGRSEEALERAEFIQRGTSASVDGRESTNGGQVGTQAAEPKIPSRRGAGGRSGLRQSIAIAGKGVFYYSANGQLQRMTDAGLRVARSRDALDLAGGGRVVNLLSAHSPDGSAIGVVRSKDTTNVNAISLIDPDTMEVLWERELPATAAVFSIVGLNGGFAYIDGGAGSVVAIGQNSTEIVRKLPTGTLAAPTVARILSLSEM